MLQNVLVIYNEDYPAVSGLEEPPSSGEVDNAYSGEKARSSIEQVARAVESALARKPRVRVERAPVRSMDDVRSVIATRSPSLVFNLCESLECDARFEPEVARMIGELGIPFTGNNEHALGLCLDKYAASTALHHARIPVPMSVLISSLDDLFDRHWRFPLIVKPNCEDGSTGIEASSVVHDWQGLSLAVRRVIEMCERPAIVQDYIEGREFNVAVLGTESILGISEIDFSGLPVSVPRIVSYASKWHEDSDECKGTVPVCPNLDDELRDRLESVALGASMALGLHAYGRIDIRLSADGTPYVIDVNPNCDLDPEAGLARTARARGLDYEGLVSRIVDLALEER